MRPSPICINLIKQFEGFRSKPYKCSAGIPTIGYGSTFYLNGEKVTMKDSPISKEFAEDLLLATVTSFSSQINPLITIELPQHQYDALVSFTYNVGIAAFSKSTMLKLVNAGKDASGEFQKWVKAGGKVVKGLEKRRECEKKCYLGQY